MILASPIGSFFLNLTVTFYIIYLSDLLIIKFFFLNLIVMSNACHILFGGPISKLLNVLFCILP